MGSFWVILIVLTIILSRSAGKKISDAAGKNVSELPPAPPFPQVFPADEETPSQEGEAPVPYPDGFSSEPEEFTSVPEDSVPMVSAPELPVEAPQALPEKELPKKTTLVDAAEQKKDDKKIDPKKMVVYSEIFRAKYLE